MNLALRNPTNGRVRDHSSPAGIHFTPAFYRIYTNTLGLSVIAKQNPTTPVCQSASASELLGCFMQGPSPCSLGYGGRELWESGHAEPLALGNGATAIDPSRNGIQDLILDPTSAYPLSRKVYYNTLIGFDDPLFTSGTLSQQGQGKLKACALLKYPLVLLNDSDRLRAWLSKNMWFLIDFHERDPIRVGSGGSDFDHVFSIIPVPNALSRNEGIFQCALANGPGFRNALSEVGVIEHPLGPVREPQCP